MRILLSTMGIQLTLQTMIRLICDGGKTKWNKMLKTAPAVGLEPSYEINLEAWSMQRLGNVIRTAHLNTSLRASHQRLSRRLGITALR